MPNSRRNIELVLYPKMPKLYDTLKEEVMHHLANIFGQLLNAEIPRYSESKVRVITKLEDKFQFVFIDHDGSLNAAAAEMLNSELEGITQGREWNINRSGNKMAANSLRYFGGSIKLESITDNPYFTRTALKIPIKK